jgi:hypothetical protein
MLIALGTACLPFSNLRWVSGNFYKKLRSLVLEGGSTWILILLYHHYWLRFASTSNTDASVEVSYLRKK